MGYKISRRYEAPSIDMFHRLYAGNCARQCDIGNQFVLSMETYLAFMPTVLHVTKRHDSFGHIGAV